VKGETFEALSPKLAKWHEDIRNEIFDSVAPGCGALVPSDDCPTAVVDKQLGNFRNVFQIATLFPTACIVETTRDPKDLLWSLYSTPFDEGSISATAKSLSSLRSAYKDYVGLMRHWRRAKAGIARRITQLANEDLVRDPDAEMQRIFSFCELGRYDPSASVKHSQPIVTASYLQARGTLSRRSRPRWAPYAAELATHHAKLDKLLGKHAELPRHRMPHSELNSEPQEYLRYSSEL
jgi:hypothetical protein